MHPRNNYNNGDGQEFSQVSHASHNSDYCPSCEYIPPPHAPSAHAQQERTLSRNQSRTLIRDPVTHREISVHSRSDSGANYNEPLGCTCINPSACLCLLTAALLIMIGALSSHAGLFTNCKYGPLMSLFFFAIILRPLIYYLPNFFPNFVHFLCLFSVFSSQSSLLSSSSLTGPFANERVFRGQFLITRGEAYDPRFEFPDSNHFKDAAKRWSERLDNLFNRTNSARTSTPSMLSKLYKRSEILALERGPKGAGSDDTLIHFNLHFKRIKPPTPASDANSKSESGDDPLNSASIYVVIATELLRMKSASARNQDHILGKGVSIDQSSLDIEERRPSGTVPVMVNGGHVSNPNWIRSASGSSFPFFSGRSEVLNTESGLTNGRSSVGIAQPSWLEPRTRFPGLLEGLKEGNAHPGPRTCSSVQLALCQHSQNNNNKDADIGIFNGGRSDIGISEYRIPNDISYNTTSWPNLVGHWNMSALLDSVLMFRSLIDAECHPRAKDFICRLLQPECLSRDKEDTKNQDMNTDSDSIEDIAVFPCRDFCTEFWSGCGIFISEFISDQKIKDRMKCSNFPRFDRDPDDDNFQYIDDHTFGKHDRDKNGDKSGKSKVTRKRKEGRRCRNK